MGFHMTFSRRDILKTTGATLSMIALPPALAQSPARASDLKLRASAFSQAIRPGVRSDVWGFNGSVPGPVLRFRKGDLARIAVTNDLPAKASTTVHWHGIRVPNAMDGVPQVTQVPIPVGETFTYEFRVPDSGTYWYHPHQMSFEQVARGMYGTLIVEEEKPIDVDREVLWVLSDFKLGPSGRQVEDFGRMQDLGGGGRLGNIFALNGRQTGRENRLLVRSNERIRLRLVNTATARIFLLDFRGQKPMVVSYDGQGVEPHPLPQGLLLLGPGMRTDLILDCEGTPGQTFPVIDRRDKGYQIATLAFERKPPLRSRPLGGALRVESNGFTEPDMAKLTEHFIVFEGGMLGKPAIGLVDGKPLKVPEIMQQHGLHWTMNYVAEHEHAMLHTPMFNFRKGEHIALKMINETEFEHPMHLHGHSFRVLRVNDRPTRFKEWRDTVMVAPRGTVDIAFVAENPGEWMFHCHILEHAAGGMMGTVAVE
jgi:FtsP/CotA-like multicopper oxidase with cupredoxin domain